MALAAALAAAMVLAAALALEAGTASGAGHSQAQPGVSPAGLTARSKQLLLSEGNKAYSQWNMPFVLPFEPI